MLAADNPGMSSYLGIEIGGTKLQVVTGDGRGDIHLRRRLVVDQARGGEGIREQLRTVVTEMLATARPVAVGVGFGGPVDWKAGETRCSHQIDGWAGFGLGDWLRTLTGLPVKVDNDANVAALGEALSGSGAGLNPVVYMTMGSGVGGGLVVDGGIYHGAAPGEVEIGHLRLDRQGTLMEARCAGWAVDRRLRALRETLPGGVLDCLLGDTVGGEARFLAPALQAGDAAARQVLDEIAGDLAFGLSHVVHLLHPEVVILGGGLSLVGEPLRQAVAAALPGFIMDAFAPGPRVVLAALGEDAVPAGALLLAQSTAPSRTVSG